MSGLVRGVFPSLGGVASRAGPRPTRRPWRLPVHKCFRGRVFAPFLSRISRTVERPTQNWHDPGESDCLIKTKHSDGRKVDADGM